MAEDGRTTKMVRIRALPAEAAALRAEADRLGVTLSRLVLDLAAAAGLVEHRGSPGRITAGHRGSPRSTAPDLVARIDALEARVLALEAGPGRAPPRPAVVRPAAAGAPERPKVKAPTRGAGGRRYAADDPRRPVERSELPPGFPATGAELADWRDSTGQRRQLFATAVGQSRQSLHQQEMKGDAPLSSGLALKLVAAVEAGKLPAPG